MLLGKVSKLKAAAQRGEDSQGNAYQSINEMWQREVKAAAQEKAQGEESWYKKQVEYWDVRIRGIDHLCSHRRLLSTVC